MRNKRKDEGGGEGRHGPWLSSPSTHAHPPPHVHAGTSASVIVAQGAQDVCLPLSPAGGGPEGTVVVVCSPLADAALIVPFAGVPPSERCPLVNQTAPEFGLNTSTCTPVPPELGLPTGIAAVVVSCGLPTPRECEAGGAEGQRGRCSQSRRSLSSSYLPLPLPRCAAPSPSVRPSHVPVAIVLYANSGCSGQTTTVADTDKNCLPVPNAPGGFVVDCAPDGTEAVVLVFDETG